jgi:hypothetical protein
MSVIINVEQSPLTITPSNGEHIYTISSTGYTLQNFKFVIDVYFRPDSINFSGNPQPTARLKVRPNSYGKAIVELEEIVRTFLKANPRFSGTTYPYLNFVAEENSVLTMSDAKETRTLNAFNIYGGNNLSATVPVLWHAEQYIVKVGCEYEDTTTNSIILDMDLLGSYQPAAINIFPGVDNKLIPSPFLSGATLGSGYTQSPNFFQVDNQSWYYYDLFRHIYTTGPDTTCGPREFLNAGGREYKTISQDGFVSQRVRRRQHHPDCPIIISFLDGQNDYFNNQTTRVVVRGADLQGQNYTYSAYTANVSTGFTNNYDIWKNAVFYMPWNITQSGTNVIPQDSQKLCFYLTSGSDMNFSARTSEILEFYMEDPDCINQPIHLLFLNGRGMWDTYTFGKKSSKTFEVERKQYRQESSLDKSFYSMGSSQRGITIYDQLATYKIECMSNFMTDEDTVVVEEIFNSPEVYIIEGTTEMIDPCAQPDIDNCESCLGEIRQYQYLLPVVLENRELKKFQRQYQKIFQYTFDLRYADVKRYRTQG